MRMLVLSRVEVRCGFDDIMRFDPPIKLDATHMHVLGTNPYLLEEDTTGMRPSLVSVFIPPTRFALPSSSRTVDPLPTTRDEFENS